MQIFACTTFDDVCPNGQYTKVVDVENSAVDRAGHPIVCSNDGRVVRRAASVHYPVLGNLLHHVNNAIRCSSRDIDEAQSLMANSTAAQYALTYRKLVVPLVFLPRGNRDLQFF